VESPGQYHGFFRVRTPIDIGPIRSAFWASYAVAMMDFSWRQLYAETTALSLTTEGAFRLEDLKEMPFDQYEWVRREIPRMVKEARENAKRS
jgi:hypothetical protein